LKRFEKGLDGAALWAPYLAARDSVERYPEGRQEPPSALDYLEWDEAAATVTLGLVLSLPSRCPRFAARECPRMIPMGHENEHETCNYWDWPGMEFVAPGIEVYPEWQRFDCHKYYPLFQNHLVGEALAAQLGATPQWMVHTAKPDDEKMLKVYANFSSRPEAFHWKPLAL
jgi:hypothetical protein